MSEQDVFILAEQALKKVIDQIKDDQWSLKVPPGLSRHKDLSLRDLVNYHAYDDAWVPDVLAGKTIKEVGAKYDGDLLGDDPKASYNRINAASQAAVTALDDPDKMVHLSYGDFPAREYLKHTTSYRAFQAWDIARLIGADDKLPDELVRGLYDQLLPDIEQWRAMGVFGPAVEVPESADLQTKLLGMAGRKA